MSILSRNTARQTQDRLSLWKRTRSNAKSILNSPAAVIYQNKGNVAGNNEKVGHLWTKTWFTVSSLCYSARICSQGSTPKRILQAISTQTTSDQVKKSNSHIKTEMQRSVLHNIINTEIKNKQFNSCLTSTTFLGFNRRKVMTIPKIIQQM